MTTYNVTDTNSLWAAMTNVIAGDDIVCANGTYGPANFTHDAPSGGVTISAANVGLAEFVDNADFSGASGWTFDGMKFSGTNELISCSNLTFINCVIPAYVNVRQGSGIAFRYCDCRSGTIDFQGNGTGTNGTVYCCLFRDSVAPGSDLLRCSNWNGLVVENCTFWDMYTQYPGGGTTGDPVHADAIQVFANPTGPQNITIRGNFFYDDPDTQQQIENLWPQLLNLNVGSNLLVEDNFGCGGSANGFMMGCSASGGVARGNGSFPWPSSTSLGRGSGAIRILSYSNGFLVEQNVYGSLTDQGTGTTVQNNYQFSMNPAASNYAEDIIDWTNEGAAVSDYVPVPGSPIEGGNYGFLDRVTGILDGSQDFYWPDGTLQLADATPEAPSIPGTPTIDGTLNVGQTITFTASTPVTGYPIPTRTWQVHNSISGLVQDSANNFYQLQAGDQGDQIYVIQREENSEGVATAPSANTGTIGAELSAPDIATLSPADNATGVDPASQLILTLDEDAQPGFGAIQLWRDGAARETWDVPSDIGTGPHTVSISGDTITIDTQNDMMEFADYHIIIGAGTFENLSGVAFPGISDPTVWNWTTGSTAGSPPTISGLTINLVSA